jgi:hypothetical protein
VACADLHEDEGWLADAKEEHPEQLQRENEQLEEGVDGEEWPRKPAHRHHITSRSFMHARERLTTTITAHGTHSRVAAVVDLTSKGTAICDAA